MTRPDYQMISHRALLRLLHRDCEFQSGSVATFERCPLFVGPIATVVADVAAFTLCANARSRYATARCAGCKSREGGGQLREQCDERYRALSGGSGCCMPPPPRQHTIDMTAGSSGPTCYGVARNEPFTERASCIRG